MAGASSTEDRRCRGRPQVRPDDETRAIIFDAARHQFAVSGFAATSMESVARDAGVSTKTLYRLIPNKAALFEGMVAERLDRLVDAISIETGDGDDLEAALVAALTACTNLVLDPDVVGLQRMVLQECTKFGDLAATFYKNGIQRTQAALADWLRGQQKRGRLAIDDPAETAGFLIGMVASAPQRAAIYGGLPLPSPEALAARVRRCAALFLRGAAAR